MFDVDWSDPNRESVGDRRARKEKEKEKDKDKGKGKEKRGRDSGSQNDRDDPGDDGSQKADDQDQESNRNSGSVRSSVSSIEKQFGFFGGKHRKKGSSASRKVKATSLAGSSLRSPTIEEQPQGELVSVPSTKSRRTRATGAEESPGLPPKRLSRAGNHSGEVSTDAQPGLADSVFSKLDDTDRAPGGSLFGCDITNPQPGSNTLYQELGDGVSMVTKTTVVSLRDRTDEDSDFLVSKVHVSAGDFDPHEWQKPTSSNTTSPEAPLAGPIPSTPSTQFNEVVHLPLNAWAEAQTQPRPPNGDQLHHLPVIAESSNDEAVSDDPTRRKRLKRPPRPMLSAPAISPATLRPADNPETWKAPDEWDISPAESAISGRTTEDPFDLAVSNKLSALTLDLTRMQQEVDRMLQATPQVILQRLKEGDAGVQEQHTNAKRTGDVFHAIDMALASKEREMEKQRWLLSALYNMETIWDPQDQISRPAPRPAVQKVLALFESQATASYLAAANNTMPVYHLSPEPLNHKQYPNIHPTVCPSVSASAVCLAPESFSSVSCIPIISILPSSEIPRLLQKVHQVLAPGGYLHLVVIDPWPVASSMGPLLQRWIDENLVFNLELQFRCTHPGRMFPVWLEDACLRAPGSIITHTRFPAIPQRYEPDGDSDDASARSKGSAEEEAAIKKELRTTVGRTLWQQIWGPFAAGENWWWEDPDIVDECIERQTHWEYKIIAACKASKE